MTRNHLILMAIGCLLPVTTLVAILIFPVQVSTVLLFGLFLLCPAWHLFMMRDYVGRPSSHHELESEL